MKKNFKNHIFVFLFIASFFVVSPLQAKNQNKLTKISTTDNQNKTELKFELKQLSKSQPQYRVFTVENPERLVVDFDDTDLVGDISNLSNPLFSSVRNSLNNQDQLRIVFDLKNSVKIDKSAIIKSKNKYYLSVQLSYENVIAPTSKTTATSQTATPSPTPKTLSAPTPKPTTDPIVKLVDKETGTIKYVIKRPKTMPTIIIDSGHGGKDPGTIGKFARSKEKFVTLGYARELKRQLDLTKKYKVFLTRDKDFFIPLNERVGIARRMKADLFISLHADSSPDSDTSGLSIYSLSETSSDKQAELLAQKENKSDIIGGADFSDASGDILKTLINLSQRNTMNDSAKFAEIVIKSIRENNVETLQKTHRFAGFRVLTAPDVPSVLIELGYLSNRDEEKRLNSLKHKKDVAESLVNSVEKYFGN